MYKSMNQDTCDQCHKVYTRWTKSVRGFTTELDCPTCEHQRECGEGHTRKARERRDRWSNFDYSQ